MLWKVSVTRHERLGQPPSAVRLLGPCSVNLLGGFALTVPVCWPSARHVSLHAAEVVQCTSKTDCKSEGHTEWAWDQQSIDSRRKQHCIVLKQCCTHILSKQD